MKIDKYLLNELIAMEVKAKARVATNHPWRIIRHTYNGVKIRCVARLNKNNKWLIRWGANESGPYSRKRLINDLLNETWDDV